jgi:hypothetical protein
LVLKWNVDGSRTFGPTGIGGFLPDHKGLALGLFSIPVGIKDSNET